MITKITGEQSFQVLTNNFSISPSNEGYTLQISADGKNFSNLFTVGAGVTRLVTGVAANSYYRLSGNESQVVINWMKTCVTEGGGSGSGTTYTAGEYISIQNDTISVTGITPDAYLTSADTQDLASQDYVDAAITAATEGFATEAYVTAATSPIQTQLDDVERVTATAMTELHESILELSGATGDYATKAYVTAATQGFLTTADTQGFLTTADTGDFLTTADTQDFMDSTDAEVISTALNDLDSRIDSLSGATQDFATEAYVTAATANLASQSYVNTAVSNKVTGSGISTMTKISQAGYDALVSGGTVDSNTFYVITGSTGN